MIVNTSSYFDLHRCQTYGRSILVAIDKASVRYAKSIGWYEYILAGSPGYNYIGLAT